jgi:hypothetical protein
MSYEIYKALSVVVEQIDEKVKQIQEALSSGTAKNFEEYRGLCGEIKGLLTARSFATDLTHNMEHLDE